MGMFDYLKCEYDLPVDGAPVDGWQTKDTPAQWLDTYTIRKDGTLWAQEYDIEDHSNPNAEGIDAIIGCMTRVNIRDVPCDMTGEVVFYNFKDDQVRTGWVEFSAQFQSGKIVSLELIEDRA